MNFSRILETVVVHSALVLCLAGSFASVRAAQDKELFPANTGFDKGTFGWVVFAPPDGKGMEFDVDRTKGQDGKACAVLSSKVETRAALAPKVGAIAVTPGNYRISLWAKASPGFSAKGPGFVVRINMLDAERKPISEIGEIYANWKGESDITLRNNPRGQALPNEWTKIDVNFEVPQGAAFFRVGFFLWVAKGTVYVDDVSFKRVD